jgi:tetratricopeptide (TPR) repeat protein
MKRVAFVALALFVLAAPARAAAPSVEEARIRFQRGVQLFHEGSFEAALAEFRKAYQVAPSYRLLYNIGQVHYELHDYVGALKSFRQYLGDGSAEIPPERRVQVDAEIKKLQGLCGYLEVTAEPEGADILVDDVPVGIAPLGGPVLVNAGLRRITATKAGRTAPVRSVTIAGGERVHVVLQVPDPPVVTSPLRPAPLRTRGRTGEQVGVWLGVAATSMLALTAGGFAFATQQAKQNFDTELDTFPSSRERIEHFRGRMTTLAHVTDALAVGALVVGGLTVTLALTRREEEQSPPRRPTRPVAVHFTPAGVILDGGF